MTFMFSWNALNDYMDIEIDKINRPDRADSFRKNLSKKRPQWSIFIRWCFYSFTFLPAFVSSRGRLDLRLVAGTCYLATGSGSSLQL